MPRKEGSLNRSRGMTTGCQIRRKVDSQLKVRPCFCRSGFAQAGRSLSDRLTHACTPEWRFGTQACPFKVDSVKGSTDKEV